MPVNLTRSGVVVCVRRGDQYSGKGPTEEVRKNWSLCNQIKGRKQPRGLSKHRCDDVNAHVDPSCALVTVYHSITLVRIDVKKGGLCPNHIAEMRDGIKVDGSGAASELIRRWFLSFGLLLAS